MDLCYSISSFSDRVSNFFSTISHSPYLPNELEIISRYENQLMKGILSVALNGHRFDKMGEINLCSYLISSYLPISFEVFLTSLFF
jgi:hypothetical protein